MKKIFLAMIRFYQLVISPITPPCCRYIPTCSQYALEAIERYGPFRGGLMAVRRVLRCHPFHPGGYDPVKSLSGFPSNAHAPSATPRSMKFLRRLKPCHKVDVQTNIKKQ